MYSIFLAIHLKFILKLFAVLVNCLQGFMQMKLMMGNIDHTACNIGAVIGCSFKAGQKIGPYEACDHIAISPAAYAKCDGYASPPSMHQ